jgi:hypothetical protein
LSARGPPIYKSRIFIKNDINVLLPTGSHMTHSFQ